MYTFIIVKYVQYISSFSKETAEYLNALLIADFGRKLINFHLIYILTFRS